jgi:hypothetical protein
MHKARAFFFVCAGIFLLALAYHLGARSAGAQAPGNPLVSGDGYAIYTANGDAYVRTNSSAPFTFAYAGNVFTGPPTPATQQTWGQLKSRYRPDAATKDK